MSRKSLLHSNQYRRVERQSPHGFIIEKTYNLFRDAVVFPEDVILDFIKPSNSVLDLGCGDGNFCIRLGCLFKNVIGIDVSNFRISKAREKVRFNDKFKFLVADMDKRLPFRGNSFDSVTAITAFQYSYDPYFTLTEIRRVLKPKGHLFIQVPNLAWFVYRFQLFFGKQIFTSLAFRKIWDGGVLHYFTFTSLTSLLKEQGFRVKKASCSGLFRKVKLLWPTLLASDIIIYAQKVRK